MTMALKGLRVLDIASLYAAPLAASIMADFGADVVKVEPPGGDGFRGTAMWPVVARGKRCITLDIRSEEGREEIRALAAKADVLVENLPPELAKRWALDWETLSSLNPRLVVVSVSCFGQTGPYAGRPGSGTIGEGFGGLTHLTGAADGPPTLPSVALGDALGAMHAVIGTMMALYARDHHTGRGQQVDVSLYEPVLAAVAQSFQYWQPGTSHPTRNGSQMPQGAPGLRNVFAARDGHVVISASTKRHADDLAVMAEKGDDEALDDAVSRWIGGQDVAPLVERLIAARIPVSPTNDLDALLRDPQVIARKSLFKGRADGIGDVVLASPSPHLSETPGRIGKTGPLAELSCDGLYAEWGVGQCVESTI